MSKCKCIGNHTKECKLDGIVVNPMNLIETLNEARYLIEMGEMSLAKYDIEVALNNMREFLELNKIKVHIE